MSLFARWVARRDAYLQREIDAAFGRAPLAPEPERDNLLAAAQQRTWRAEDATRAMSTRLDAAVDRVRVNAHARDQALAAKASLECRVRELGQEVVALRHLLERAQAPRGTDRRCLQCQEPMQFGMSHHCRKTSEYTEGVAA